MSSDRKWAYFALIVGILCLFFWGLPWAGIGFIAFAIWQLKETKPAPGDGNQTKDQTGKPAGTSSTYTQGINTGRTQKPAHSNIAGRSCYDCKHCANAQTPQAEKAGQIYCRWDSEHYYPETGKNCIDFNK